MSEPWQPVVGMELRRTQRWTEPVDDSDAGALNLVENSLMNQDIWDQCWIGNIAEDPQQPGHMLYHLQTFPPGTTFRLDWSQALYWCNEDRLFARYEPVSAGQEADDHE